MSIRHTATLVDFNKHKAVHSLCDTGKLALITSLGLDRASLHDLVIRSDISTL